MALIEIRVATLLALLATIAVVTVTIKGTATLPPHCSCDGLASSVETLTAAWAEQRSTIGRLEARVAAVEAREEAREAGDQGSERASQESRAATDFARGGPRRHDSSAMRRELLSASLEGDYHTAIDKGRVLTSEMGTGLLRAGIINVTTLYVDKVFSWQGHEVRFEKPTSEPTFSPSPRPSPRPTPEPSASLSCADHAGKPNGWFQIRIGGTLQAVWCSFTSTGSWRVGVLPMPLDGGCASSSVATPSAYSAFCTANGYPLAGRGVAQSPEAWLVMKRMLWDSNHALRQAGWPNGCAHMPMPLMFNGASVVSIFDGVVAQLPPNLGGDACYSGGIETYCGYWYNTGWNTNDNSLPDPEDYGAPSCGSCANRFVSCIGLEVT